jgi:hypothetical protein
MKYIIEIEKGMPVFFTEAEILIRDRFVEDEKSLIHIDTVLTERFKNGQTQRLTNHTFPTEVWDGIITGFDPVTMEPILDKVKLAALFASYGITLK